VAQSSAPGQFSVILRAIADDCVFCRIVQGKEPASFVYEDQLVVAFMDHQPITRGHLLVVPRRHAMLMHEVDQLSAAQTWQVTARMSEALRSSGLPCEGVNVFVADGEAAFQDVPHFHVHVIPRFPGDGFSLEFPPGYGEPVRRSELDAVAATLRSAVG
jgi:histidine triad (HIT) family protein